MEKKKKKKKKEEEEEGKEGKRGERSSRQISGFFDVSSWSLHNVRVQEELL